MIKITKGVSFATVLIFTSPIPCLTPITLSVAKPENIRNINKILTDGILKIGKAKPIISVSALATAASEKTLPITRKTAAKYPGKGPKAVST